MKSLRKVLHSIVVACAVVFTGLSDVTRAADLSLSDVPLFLGGNIDPNIILSVDDSGSMDSEILFRNNDGALWWHTGNKSFTGLDKNDNVSPGLLNFNKLGNADATWKKYTYLFPNGYATGLRVYDDQANAHYAIPPLPKHAYTRSPAYNTAYFDPAVTYQPWIGYGATTFGQIDPTSAPSDPVRAPTSTLDLTADVQKSGTNETFRMHNGETIPAGTYFRDWADSQWKSAAADIAITTARSVPIRYFPATFYLLAGTPLPAGYGYTGTVTTNGRGPAGEALDGYEIKPASFSNSAEYDAAINNFANWFSYGRKRHLATRGGIGHAFENISKTRVGSFAINPRQNVTMGDLDVSSERDTFYSTMYQYVGNGGTPNREALDHLGKQYMLNPGPITHACQQNFGIMFTDGYTNAWTGAGLGNVDGGMGAPFADTASNTMADIATHYYTTNLRSDLAAGKVPVPTACSAANPDKWLDCNANPHQVTFGVVLGIPGEIFNVNMAQTLDPFTNNPTWPTSFTNRHPSAIDDLWHATINSRGLMLEAKRPSEIADTLGSVLQDIQGRAGSASSVALNSTSLQAGASVYQARFDSNDWSGQLLSIPIAFGLVGIPDGTLLSEDWDAAEKLAGQHYDTGRNIVTFKPLARTGAPFRWGALELAQSTALDTNPSTGAPDLPTPRGNERLDYLRGEENVAGMRLRAKLASGQAKKLGDIVHSSPAYVGAPIFRYPDNLEIDKYADFKLAKTNRKPLVYAGANDGMLHAFDASTDPLAWGKEVFAYVPAAVYKNLNQLTSPTYAHRFYVDGAPTVGDAFFGGEWHTVLVGGLRAGGQAIYALDITDPPGSSDDETDIAAKVLWEFNDVEGLLPSDPDYGDKDLGDTFSEPNIVRMKNGKWAAVFGNGYNNTASDGLTTTSATGNAVLYIVDIQTGALIKKIDTGVGKTQDPKTAIPADKRPNGLATPAPIDANGDSIVDYIYAGDLFGNLWKFDVNSANENDWKVLGPSNGPLFVACAGTGTQCTTAGASNLQQPITTRPQVGRHPTKAEGFMVYFGTGKYFETGDNDPVNQTTNQTFYGVWDENKSSPTAFDRSNLLQQKIVDEVPQGFDTDGIAGDDDFFDLRVSTDNPINWDTPAFHKGWYMDLYNTEAGNTNNYGERQVTDSILRNDRIIFTTLIPSDDPCDFGGTGWLMEFDARDGSRLEESPFDLNADGRFDEKDYVKVAPPVPPSGKKSTVGIPAGPGIANDSSDPDKPKELKYTSGSTGKIEVTTENPGSGNVGRRSWRELNLQ